MSNSYIQLHRFPNNPIPVSDVYIDNYYNPFGKRCEYQKGVQTTVEFVCNTFGLSNSIYEYLTLLGSNQIKGSWKVKLWDEDLNGNNIGYLVNGDNTYILSDNVVEFESTKRLDEPVLLKLVVKGKLKIKPYESKPMKFEFGNIYSEYNQAIFNTDNYGITYVESEKENNMDEKCYKFSDGFKSKTLRQIVINEKEGIVTAITGDHDDKVVTMSKCHEEDEFDPYVGAALALAYQLFGSRTQFRKYVDEKAKKLSVIKEKKLKAKENGKKEATKSKKQK